MPRQRARLQDWIFGSRAKRLVIASLLAEPGRAWTKYALAKAVRVHTNGGLDEHLSVLRQIGLVRRSRGKWQLVEESHLVAPLRTLLTAVEELPDEPLKRTIA